MTWRICVALKNSSWYWISPKGIRSRGKMGVFPSSFLSAMHRHKKYTTFGLSWASNSHIALQAVSRKPFTFQERPVLNATLLTRLSATLSRASREAILNNEDNNSVTSDTHRLGRTFGNSFSKVDLSIGNASFSMMWAAITDSSQPVNFLTRSMIFSGIPERGIWFSFWASGPAKYASIVMPYASSASSTVLNFFRKWFTTLCRIDCAVKRLIYI